MPTNIFNIREKSIKITKRTFFSQFVNYVERTTVPWEKNKNEQFSFSFSNFFQNNNCICKSSRIKKIYAVNYFFVNVKGEVNSAAGTRQPV